ncbi:hypothetical protein DTO271G3_747 [Paecilomyces variotii]|nr:hypothetical protein DTO271G3_747 [Paecilomyces variotii]
MIQDTSATIPTEFISLTFSNASTELKPIPNASVDPDFLERYARTLDDYGFNYTLVPYDSSSYDPFTIGATIAAVTKKIKVIIALRPNTLYPTVAAKALATLDQLAAAEKAGRTDRPRIWVTFRPIVAETDELVWAKAHRILDALETHRANGQGKVPADAPPPQNVGSQRLLEIAARGEVQDRALWYPTVTATNARGASTALVGSPRTLADSIPDYVDLGAELISIRGYYNLNDAIDYGRYILPLVREELKGREKKDNSQVV